MYRTVTCCVVAWSILGCDSPTMETDGAHLELVLAAAAPLPAVDEGRIRVEGPTSRTLTVTPGSTVTIDGLRPGSYTVVLEGIAGGETVTYGERSGINVEANVNQSVTVTLASFVPEITTLGAMSGGVGVSFGAVTGASSYTVEWDVTPVFASPSSTQTSSTTAVLPLDPASRYYIRVRARTRFGTTGRAGASQGWPVLFFQSIGAGDEHSCGILESGEAYCWGRNDDGQVGDGSTTDRTLPTAVTDGMRFTAIVVGGNHNCADADSLRVYCWGRDDAGQLGVGNVLSSSTRPVRVSSAVDLRVEDASWRTTCALRGTSVPAEAYCWGGNDFGSLGIGSTGFRSLPTKVTGGAEWTELAVGQFHTCGLKSPALNAHGAPGSDPGEHSRGPAVPVQDVHDNAAAQFGSLYCWGRGTSGELGDGTRMSYLTPERIDASVGFLDLIVAGEFHTCGRDAAAQLYCWGSPSDGILGNGTTGGADVPIAVSTSATFTQLSAGEGHTCGLTSGGEVFCWGRNDSGQLGDGTTVDRLVPTRVPVSGTFTAIAVGGHHTCALMITGVGHEAFCWGANDRGQLGDGTTTDRPTPARVR